MRRRAPRPLQLCEVVAAAEEHLAASALPGLEVSYLPTRLVVGVSADDLRILEPFAERLAADLQAAQRRLAKDGELQLLGDRLEVELRPDEELAIAAPPRFRSSFPVGSRRASWRPAGPSSDAFFPHETWKRFELVFTAGSRSGTARQQTVEVALAVATPGAGVLEAPPARGLPPVSLPAEALEALGVGAAAVSSPVLTRREPRGERLEAAGGVVVVGRAPALAHLVPTAAPRNLSGRHLALVRPAAGGLSVVDLGSTNGTHLHGNRLEPFVPAPLELPARLEIGTEGSLRLDLRERAPREAAERNRIQRAAEPRWEKP